MLVCILGLTTAMSSTRAGGALSHRHSLPVLPPIKTSSTGHAGRVSSDLQATLHQQRAVKTPPFLAMQRSPLPPIPSPLTNSTPTMFTFTEHEATASIAANALATFKAGQESSFGEKIAALQAMAASFTAGLSTADMPSYTELLDLGVGVLVAPGYQQHSNTKQKQQYESALCDVILLAGSTKLAKSSDVLQTAPHVALIRALANVIVSAPSPTLQAAAASAIGLFIECEGERRRGKDAHAKAKARSERIATEAGITGSFAFSQLLPSRSFVFLVLFVLLVLALFFCF